MIAELKKLEREIREKSRPNRYGDTRISRHDAMKWADRLAAIRSEGVTEAMTERAARKLALWQLGVKGWDQLPEHDRFAFRSAAFAALTAALTDKGETP